MKSLTGKLVASHVAVILLAMALVFFISSAFVRQYETEVETSRLRQITIPLALAAAADVRVRNISGSNSDRLPTIDAQSRRLGVRLVVFDQSGQIVYDTDTSSALVGTTPTQFASQVEQLGALSQRSGDDPRIVRVEGEGELDGSTVLLTPTGRLGDRYVVGIVSNTTRYPLFRSYLPRMLLVTGVSLVLASLAGYFLSRRIAAPVTLLTRAARAMVGGNLKQQVQRSGNDEIGELVDAFNAMSSSVAVTSESQRALLANVAHELRTPLTSIHGYAQALESGVVSSPGETREALETIKRESDRMRALIVELLDLSRLESGQIQLSVQPIAIKTIFDECLTQFAPLANRKSIQFEVTNADNSCVLGDKSLLIRAIANIGANAIRHSEEGETISLSAAETPSEDAGELVKITISDRGEGIANEALPHIFDRFHRGAHGEVGLGLAITQEIVELHGGSISVQSIVGVGTSFTVTLPSCRQPGIDASLNA